MLHEVGATVDRSKKLADMQLPGVHATDQRAIEIVTKCLLLWRGVPLVLDATLVFSPLRVNGQPKPRAAVIDGIAIPAIENDLLTKYPE